LLDPKAHAPATLVSDPSERQKPAGDQAKKKVKEKRGIDVISVRDAVKKAEKNGFQLPGSVSVKNSSKQVQSTDNLKKYLRRGDRIRVVSFSGSHDCVVSIKGQFDESTFPIDREWKHDDEDGLSLFRYPKAAPLPRIKQAIKRKIANSGGYQSGLRGVVQLEATLARKFTNFAEILDEENFIAIQAIKMAASLERRKEKNKTATIKAMNEEDEKINLHLAFKVRQAMKGAASVVNNPGKVLNRKKKEGKRDKLDEILEEEEAATKTEDTSLTSTDTPG